MPRADSTPPFSSPDVKGEQYVARVRERATQLVNSGIWKGISLAALDRWLENFRTADEKYFGACLLDSFVFRSEEQVHAQIRQIFQMVLPQLVRAHADPAVVPVDWAQALASTSDERVRLVPVLRPDDPPTKSGPLIARLMARGPLRLNQKWMIWPWQVRDARGRGAHCFLFVDDFLGTGTQFARFAKVFRLQRELRGAVSAYTPLAAHNAGVTATRAAGLVTMIGASEILDSSHGLFCKKSETFNDGHNSAAAAKDFYVRLCRTRSLEIPPRYFWGYGKLALAYAFSHAMPNNSLPLFWHRSPEWQPLIER